ncbi:hypothetical protein FRB96_004523 [Tulasnella sp. 330]|nr:hypothetical protein FRB96_004523 [Tulasnella sp. 330]KAG8885648.1 hypothetical protein FRB97_000091 [Tulasnella sp. 331]KAG8890810.1 hypothetical protein FRB98_004855 [Tulasnella sp. 332]
MPSSSIPLFSPFVVGQIVGMTASGAFFAGTLASGPLNVITALKYSSLPPAAKSKLVGPVFPNMGRPAMLTSVFLTIGGYLTAYAFRPDTVSIEHSRLLLLAAGAAVVAVPHTIFFVHHVYKNLSDSNSFTGEGAEARWAGLVKQFHAGNTNRLALFLLAYGIGVYGLTKTNVE